MKKISKIGFYILLIVSSLSLGVINFGRNLKNAIDIDSIRSANPANTPFICGAMYLPFTIDPQDCWDSYSLDIIIQVMETLFTYNYSDPTLPIIPLLATDFGTWDPSHTQYTIDLRRGITFHDGSIFDADDVVFTFERQAWLYNFTGLNTGDVPDVYELYVFPNGTPVIDDVIKIDADTIKFELNGVYGPFIDLLCYPASSILTDTYYDIGSGIVERDGDIIGTGPFVFDSYEEDVEVILHAFDDYWRGKAQIEELFFKRLIFPRRGYDALLAGSIHFLKNPMDESIHVYMADPSITLANTVNGGIQYLVMNNGVINRTWRDAISYAFDYDYLINEIRFGNAVRMKSPVGVGIKYYNGSFPVPTTNYTKARLIMQSMGFGVGFDTEVDDQWIATAVNSTPFRSINYSYNIGNEVREAVFRMLIDNLAKIGIRVTDAGSNWSIVLQKIYELEGHHRNEIELLFIDRGPDFNDPANFIMPLFTNRSIAFNAAQYNGYTEAIEAGRDPLDLWNNVQLLMEQALITLDGPVREAMYDRIQELLVEDMPLCWSYANELYYAYHINLTGFQQNFLNWLYFYPCQWISEQEIPIPSYNIFIILGIICILFIFLHKKLKIQK
ncbi:MAG: ABC transporter substrate-binding protein [Candidatus Hermodarchaeota archaeon]